MIKFKKKIIRIALAVGIGIYIIFFSNSGYFARKKLINRVNSLENEINNLKKDNEKLREKIKLLQTDLDYITQLAYKLGYAKKGEKVYRFKELYESETNTNIILKEKKQISKIKIIDIYMITSLVLVFILIILVIFY